MLNAERPITNREMVATEAMSERPFQLVSKTLGRGQREP
jgi:hypothetical protein